LLSLQLDTLSISFCEKTFEFVNPEDLDMMTKVYFKLNVNCKEHRKRVAREAKIGRENAKKHRYLSPYRDSFG